MIKLPKEVGYESFNFSANKYEFINWFNTLFEEKNIIDEIEIEIETICYMYYRSANYNKLDLNTVLRALMVCVDLSLEWRINSLERAKKERKDSEYIYTNRFYLRKFYNEFIISLKYETPLFNEIEREIYKLNRQKSITQAEMFDFVCERFGRSILQFFNQYVFHEKNRENLIKYIKSFNPRYIEALIEKKDYQLKELISEGETIAEELISIANRIFCNNCNNNTISFMASTSGLAVDLDVEYIGESDKGSGYYHIFNFFGYLQRNDLKHPLSNKEVYNLAYSYCNKNKIHKRKEFLDFLRNSYFGYQPLFRHLFKFLGGYQGINLKYISYDQAFCHCIVLCEDEDDLKKTMLQKRLWNKLNTVTAHIMNIYYSELDEKGILSGYELRNKLNREYSFRISVENIPSLLLWHNDINDYKLISLEGIDIENYFKVVRKIVNTIDDYLLSNNILSLEQKNNIFLEALQIAKDEASKIKQNIGGTPIVHNQYNFNNNGGNVGNMGKDNIIKDSELNFSSSLEQSTSKCQLTNADLKQLKEIIAFIEITSFESMEKSTKIKTALQLQEILEAEQDKDEEKRAISINAWRNFLNSNKKNVLTILDVVAKSMTITSGLKNIFNLF